MAKSRLRQRVRTDCIVADSRDWIALEQRYVLKSRRVVDNLRLKTSENVVEQMNIIHASQHRNARQLGEGRFQVLPDLEQVVLRRIQQDDAAWTSRSNRLDQGRSYISSSAGYQYRLSGVR